MYVRSNKCFATFRERIRNNKLTQHLLESDVKREQSRLLLSFPILYKIESHGKEDLF